MEFECLEIFQNAEGSRVASRWRLTGRNNGIMGTEPDGAPIEMVGTAVWEVDGDGLLRHNWVERNAWEGHEIGRASCRERVCQYVYISVVAVAVKKKHTKRTHYRAHSIYTS